MNVCRLMHPMSTSGYYILVTHYDIVSPVPRRGVPHEARPAALRPPHAALPTAAVVGRPAANRVPVVRQGPEPPRAEGKGALARYSRPSEQSTNRLSDTASRVRGPGDRHRRLGWDWVLDPSPSRSASRRSVSGIRSGAECIPESPPLQGSTG